MLDYNNFIIKFEKSVKHLNNVTLDLTKLQQIFTYVNLLLKWNKVYSLTAITKLDDIINLHLLDALAIMPHLLSTGKLLDVGSGMGIPGIMIAIYYPQLQVSLIDSSSKKSSFLQQVAIEAKLANLKVINKRVEDFNIAPRDKFNLVICRAFSSIDKFITCSKHLITMDGFYLLMKSQNIYQELASFNSYSYNIIELTIPNYHNKRFLLKIDNHE